MSTINILSVIRSRINVSSVLEGVANINTLDSSGQPDDLYNRGADYDGGANYDNPVN